MYRSARNAVLAYQRGCQQTESAVRAMEACASDDELQGLIAMFGRTNNGRNAWGKKLMLSWASPRIRRALIFWLARLHTNDGISTEAIFRAILTVDTDTVRGALPLVTEEFFTDPPGYSFIYELMSLLYSYQDFPSLRRALELAEASSDPDVQCAVDFFDGSEEADLAAKNLPWWTGPRRVPWTGPTRYSEVSVTPYLESCWKRFTAAQTEPSFRNAIVRLKKERWADVRDAALAELEPGYFLRLLLNMPHRFSYLLDFDELFDADYLPALVQLIPVNIGLISQAQSLAAGLAGDGRTEAADRLNSAVLREVGDVRNQRPRPGTGDA